MGYTDKNKEINTMDKDIIKYKKELSDLENKNNKCKINIIDAKKELNMTKKELALKSEDLNLEKSAEEDENKLSSLERMHKLLESQILGKNEDIANLEHDKEELIKKCLMNLHSKMKKDYKKVNEDHDRYVELYTKAREERHALERKMMNLKFFMYKNFNVRLV